MSIGIQSREPTRHTSALSETLPASMPRITSSVDTGPIGRLPAWRTCHSAILALAPPRALANQELARDLDHLVADLFLALGELGQEEAGIERMLGAASVLGSDHA